MKLFLHTDVRGLCSRKLYGKRGQPVTLIADHYDMLIVKGDGDPFPVRKADVSETLEENAEPLKEPLKTLKEPPPAVPAKAGRWKKTKSVNSNPTLF